MTHKTISDWALMERNHALNEHEMRLGKTVLSSRPRTLSVALTSRCNVACRMCFTLRMPKKDMSPELLATVAELFPTAETVRWNDAGEIFAIRDVEPVLEIIGRQRLKVSYVSTNLMAAEEHMDFLASGAITDLHVSVDAATPETYEYIRRGSKWDVLTRNLQRIKDTREQSGSELPRLTLVFIGMRRNIHELPDFVRFAHRYGAVAIHVLRLLPDPVEFGASEDQILTPAEELAWYRRALPLADQLGVALRHIALDEEGARREGADKDAMPIAPAHLGAPVRFVERLQGRPYCPVPWQESLVDVDGQVRPCCYIPTIMGDLREQTFEEVWNGERYQKLRRDMLDHKVAECKKCPFMAKQLGYHPLDPRVAVTPWEQRIRHLTAAVDLVRLRERYCGSVSEVPAHWVGETRAAVDKPQHQANELWELGGMPAELAQEELDALVRRHARAEQQRIAPDQPRAPVAGDGSGGLWRRLRSAAVRRVRGMLLRLLAPVLEQQRAAALTAVEGHVAELSRDLRLAAESVTGLARHTGQFLNRQRDFNARAVQLINALVNEVDIHVEGQKDVNAEVLRAMSLAYERQDTAASQLQVLAQGLQIAYRDAANGNGQRRSIPWEAGGDWAGRWLLRCSFVDHDVPATFLAGEARAVAVTVRNETITWWLRDAAVPIRLGYQWLWPQDRSPVGECTSAADLPENVAPGAAVRLTLELRAPLSPGGYALRIGMAVDDRWLHDFGGATLDLPVQVAAGDA
ncbi:MAG: SPASM domain-containing protein [Candidatus Schekmanbacteria bacterium]|nr:SPASM domain-containing protein [Candidatus Schekmanbacteria bacterium]